MTCIYIKGNYNTVRRKLANLVYSKGHAKISRGFSRKKESRLRAEEGRARDGMARRTIVFGTKGEARAVVGSKSKGEVEAEDLDCPTTRI